MSHQLFYKVFVLIQVFLLKFVSRIKSRIIGLWILINLFPLNLNKENNTQSHK